MEINRFEKVDGSNIEVIEGQIRYGYSKSTFDFYDVEEYIEKYETFPGEEVYFYDLQLKHCFLLFKKELDIVYGQPYYWDGSFYILQGDFQKHIMSILKFVPGEEPESIFWAPISDLNTYNLRLVGEGVNLISQDDDLISYYPRKFCFPMDVNEGLIRVEEDRVYLSQWIEEGIDEEELEITEDYRYYEKLVVKDLQGNLISEEVGALCQMPDGKWYLS